MQPNNETRRADEYADNKLKASRHEEGADKQRSKTWRRSPAMFVVGLAALAVWFLTCLLNVWYLGQNVQPWFGGDGAAPTIFDGLDLITLCIAFLISAVESFCCLAWLNARRMKEPDTPLVARAAAAGLLTAVIAESASAAIRGWSTASALNINPYIAMATAIMVSTMVLSAELVSATCAFDFVVVPAIEWFHHWRLGRIHRAAAKAYERSKRIRIIDPDTERLDTDATRLAARTSGVAGRLPMICAPLKSTVDAANREPGAHAPVEPDGILLTQAPTVISAIPGAMTNSPI